MEYNYILSFFDHKAGHSILYKTDAINQRISTLLLPTSSQNIQEIDDIYYTCFENYQILVCYFQLKNQQIIRNAQVYSVAMLYQNHNIDLILKQSYRIKQLAYFYKQQIEKQNYNVKKVNPQDILGQITHDSEQRDENVKIQLLEEYKVIIYFSLLCNYRVAIYTFIPLYQLVKEAYELSKIAILEILGVTVQSAFLGYIDHYNVKNVPQDRINTLQQIPNFNGRKQCGQLCIILDPCLHNKFDVVIDLTGKMLIIHNNYIKIKNTNLITTQNMQKIFAKFHQNKIDFKFSQATDFTKMLYQNVLKQKHGKQYGIGMNTFSALRQFWFNKTDLK